MGRIDYWATGIELYNSRKYKEAAEHFMHSACKERSSAALVWLGSCYESGLGVEKDLILAKDIYSTAVDRLGHSEKKGKWGTWLQNRLQQLHDTPTCSSISRFIDGIGNVKVIKNINGPQKPQLRYNIDETVVSTDTRDSFAESLHFAQETIACLNKEWTCDGRTRFFDGYTLNTHHFTLHVTRGDSEHYTTRLHGRDCHVTFPLSANLNYIYVQESILKKVKDVVYKRAQAAIPPVLQRVSQRINVPYRKCTVVKSLGNYSATYYSITHDIAFSARCIQLPEKSLEALCVHELTHHFIPGHGKDFHDKMLQLGGREMCDLDKHLWEEALWPYLHI